MKFSILQQDFLPALQAAVRSVGFRSTLPVLDNILLSTEGKKLKIAATNLEIGTVRFIQASVEKEGAITVPAKTLLELISGLEGKITADTEGEILNVHCGSFSAQINGITASEFPAIPLADKVGVEFPKEVLLQSAQILFAAASDEGRPVLTGVLTEVKDGKMDFVATDGFRLAHRQVVLADGERSRTSVEGFKSLIPKSTYEEVLRILDEEEKDKVTISPSNSQNQIIFSTGEVVVSSRLIEGQFPAWEKIIPQNFVTRAILSREGFLKAIKLAAVFARGESNIVVINIKSDALILQSSAKELGSQENKIDAQVAGEDLAVAFNTKFLLDALSADGATQIIMEFSGPLSACLIKPVGEEGLEYILMPVRLT